MNIADKVTSLYLKIFEIFRVSWNNIHLNEFWKLMVQIKKWKFEIINAQSLHKIYALRSENILLIITITSCYGKSMCNWYSSTYVKIICICSARFVHDIFTVLQLRVYMNMFNRNVSHSWWCIFLFYFSRFEVISAIRVSNSFLAFSIFCWLSPTMVILPPAMHPFSSVTRGNNGPLHKRLSYSCLNA